MRRILSGEVPGQTDAYDALRAEQARRLAVVGTDRIAVLTPRFYGFGRAVLACRGLIGGHAFLLGGRTFDERCDDVEGALVRWGCAAAARLRRSRLFGAASRIAPRGRCGSSTTRRRCTGSWTPSGPAPCWRPGRSAAG